MDVILLERIRKLGQMGDVVTVKDGYARNFLLPQNKALRANEINKKRFETERADLEARNLELKGEAEQVGSKVDGQSFVAIRQAGDTGQLYGSVSSRDIAELISENGVHLDRNQVLLDRPIKVLGLHPVVVSLHPEVEVTVEVNVARTEEEAERQARGEDVTIDKFAEEDEAPAVEEVFEEGASELEEGVDLDGEAASEDSAEAATEEADDEDGENKDA
ncbi:MAG: hypothetical protein DHS20C08_05680 [Rhodomicrobium sp.]|nr:MAG: hypothetical protein DHS20C08_05680 [Rhodomicrobium sp.]